MSELDPVVNVFAVIHGYGEGNGEIERLCKSLSSARQWMLNRVKDSPRFAHDWDEVSPDNWRRGFETYNIEELPLED